MNEHFWSRRVPPGESASRQWVWCFVGNVVAALYSFRFLAQYLEARGELYYGYGKEAVLIEGARMTAFSDLMEGALYGFPIAALWMLCFIPFYLASFYQGSRSIYLMRRLPSHGELWRRTASLPLYCFAATVAACALTALVWLGVYWLATPQAALP